MKLLYTFLIFLIFIGCNSIKQTKITSVKLITKKEFSPLVMETWHQKDYQQDTIPGISLDKWYSQNKKGTERKNIIVAVIDTKIDLNHEDLKGQIWTNPNENPSNKIDDDHNGYVDDVNGWSFIGAQNGGCVVWSNYEYVRLIRDWRPLFKNKTESQIGVHDLSKYKEYKRAIGAFDENCKYYNNWLKSLKHNVAIFPLAKDTLKYFFPKEDYTFQQLDSMYKKYKINDKKYRQRRDDNDKDLGALIDYMMGNIGVHEKTLEDIKNKEKELDSIVNKNLNLNYDERTFIGDNPTILEKGYGNSSVGTIVVEKRLIQNHSTKVSGIIAADRENDKGIKGIAKNIKVMPLNVCPTGDEHDKDISMAIRYAVDNGAKVINMSFSKEFSLHKEWVFDAFKYAENHNVLLIHSAGNSSHSVDENICYPNDINYDNSKEVFNNFINVGSITHKLDSTFVSSFSNYGKKNVDLFAPGDEIYTTSPGNNYESDSGTSLAAPMVSGTAALIWSYYPKLTAAQVKQIILDSGTAYDLEVLVPGGEGKRVPFSELSKSGKVLNVYNAMQLAEEVNNIKKHKTP